MFATGVWNLFIGINLERGKDRMVELNHYTNPYRRAVLNCWYYFSKLCYVFVL